MDHARPLCSCQGAAGGGEEEVTLAAGVRDAWGHVQWLADAVLHGGAGLSSCFQWLLLSKGCPHVSSFVLQDHPDVSLDPMSPGTYGGSVMIV